MSRKHSKTTLAGILLAIPVLAACCLVSIPTQASTIVRFETVLGDVDVRLYDEATPLSVDNFMNYVEDGDYADSFIHRSVPGFIIQGGGFRWQSQLEPVPEDPSVMNEFGISNLRGTLAYAKVKDNPNSATSEWFFNLVDNSSNLDHQNGGFTVFGRVLGDGMDIVDAISELLIVNAGEPFETLPVLDSFDGMTVFREDLVFINNVTERDIPEGDYNRDGVVDAADYAVWRDTLGSTTQAEADGNGDGIVDAADYTLWESAFGNSMPAAVVSASSVPEPSTVAAALIGFVAIARVYAGSLRRGQPAK